MKKPLPNNPPVDPNDDEPLKKDEAEAAVPSQALPPGAYKRKEEELAGESRFWGKSKTENRGMDVGGYENASNVWVDVTAKIWSFDGNVYDVTDDIISGSITRSMDQATSLSITLSNEGDKYRQRMIPNDRIVIETRRGDAEYTAFTGYIINTSMYNLVRSREINLECYCIIRRLSQKYWDANLPENILALSSPDPDPGSTISQPYMGSDPDNPDDQNGDDPDADNQDDPDADSDDNGDNGNTSSDSFIGAADEPTGEGGIPDGSNLDPANPDEQEEGEEEDENTDDDGQPIPGSEDFPGNLISPDMTLAFLLVAPDHIGLNPDYVFIQKFPQKWSEEAERITQENAECAIGWSEYIVCPDPVEDCSEDDGGTGDTGDGDTGDTPLSGGENNEKGFNFFVDKGLTEEQSAGIIGNLIQESGDPINPKQSSSGIANGIAQWGSGADGSWWDRGLIPWTEDTGKDPWELSTQLEYIWYGFTEDQTEFQQSVAYDAVKSSNTVEDAVVAFQDNYERCGVCVTENRIKFANQVLEEYGGGGGGTEANASGESSLPPNMTSRRYVGAADTSGDRYNGAGKYGIEGGQVTTEYNAPETVANSGLNGKHAALDIAAAEGAPVYAVYAGTATHMPNAGGNPYTVCVDYGEYSAVYLHNSKFGKEGDVEPGDIIAYVGSTGYVTGPHVHLAVDTSCEKIIDQIVNGSVDPEELFGEGYTPSKGDDGGTGDDGMSDSAQPCGSGREGDQSGKGDSGNMESSGDWGVPGGFILSPYGAPSSYNNGVHNGVDIATGEGEEGAAINALASGKALSVSEIDSGCGAYTIVLKYDDGPYVELCHNSSAAVSTGDTFQKGDKLGEIGCQGNCEVSSPDWPHVHIKCSNDEAIGNDPLYMFNAAVNDIDPAIALGIDDRGSQKMFEEQQEGGNGPSPNSAGYTDAHGTLINAVTRQGGTNPSDLITDRHGNIDSSYTTNFIAIGKKLVDAPYRWGGGHDEKLSAKKARKHGVDTSGLFNVIRYNMGFENWDIGGTPDYLNILTDLRPFNPNTKYEIGTVLINIGGGDVIGHMGMVIDNKQHVLEANGGKGRVYREYTVKESNKGWSGYTHVGYMADVGTIPLIAESPKSKNTPSVSAGKNATPAPQVGAADSEKNPLTSQPTTDSNGWNFEPHACQVAHYMNEKYGCIVEIGGRRDDPLPEHPSGRAMDLMVDALGTTTESGKACGDDICAFIQANRDALAVEGVIWYAQMDYDGSGLVPYSGANGTVTQDHKDHVHLYLQASPTANFGEGLDDPGTADGGTGDDDGTGEDGGTGDDSGTQAAGEDEPCITRHPLGVYKLASQAFQELYGAEGLNSITKRQLALNNGDMNAVKENIPKFFPENEMEKFPEIFLNCQEQRNWIHFAEAFKESYLPTIQAVKDAGMYTMMSLGTGEIVFWYPELMRLLADDFISTPEDEVSEEQMRNGEVTAKQERELKKKYPSLKGEKLEGRPIEEVIDEYPETTKYFGAASGELETQASLSGGTFDDSNAQILTRPLVLEDIDLVDFSLYVSDEPLVTHYYVQGSYNPWDGAESNGIHMLKCYRWSTIFDHPLFAKRFETNPKFFDPNIFIQKYGVRSKTEQVPYIKTVGMAQLYAEAQLLRSWLDCFRLTLSTSYLPEIYPGMKIHIKSLGIECMVIQATHSFGSTWETQISVSMPLQITDESKVPPLPFWNLFDEAELSQETPDPNGTANQFKASSSDSPEGSTQKGTKDPKEGELADEESGTGLEGGGSLFDRINAKRAADNEKVRAWLNEWTYLRNNPELMEQIEELGDQQGYTGSKPPKGEGTTPLDIFGDAAQGTIDSPTSEEDPIDQNLNFFTPTPSPLQEDE